MFRDEWRPKDMKKIWGNVSEVLKRSATEIKTNWKFSQLIQGRSQKMKMYALIYMNTGFFPVYVSLCFVSLLYLLFGIIGGTILGIKENPYWFLLFLLPAAVLPFMYFVHIFMTKNSPIIKEEYVKKHSIQLPKRE